MSTCSQIRRSVPKLANQLFSPFSANTYIKRRIIEVFLSYSERRVRGFFVLCLRPGWVAKALTYCTSLSQCTQSVIV